MDDNGKWKASENCKIMAAITAAAAGGFAQYELPGWTDLSSFLKENGGPWDVESLQEAFFVHLYKLASETWNLIQDENYLGDSSEKVKATIKNNT